MSSSSSDQAVNNSTGSVNNNRRSVNNSNGSVNNSTGSVRWILLRKQTGSGPHEACLLSLEKLLLHILNTFPTRQLLAFTCTCRHFHSLILRILHNRLQIAAGLNNYKLYLECARPSESQTATSFFCTSLGTPGLQELYDDINRPFEDDERATRQVGQVRRVGELYSRFRPQKKEPPARGRFVPPGDIPGSRTHPSSYVTPETTTAEDEVVSKTVTVDAHDLFSQLSTQAYLGKKETSRGYLISIQEVTEGTVRVWRDWLSKHSETNVFSDGEPVVIHRDAPLGPQPESTAGRSAATTVSPLRDPTVLWVNTRDQSVGVKFRVRQKQWKMANPVLFESENEVAVSYLVEFEQVYVRTAHLLLKLEEAEEQVLNSSGKSIVFGSYVSRV
ncbi:f-box domain-containing protein [Teratosphaeria destructans]|uniref:F-box domain-containing protein n=1 Tax=Teratosphaeria destructans TaxID=418781 RepID=A0A9W7W1B8_9PEZI|nr:f-box domain-containing protein [Teratosphaeria destructans]